jgi:hypothetical protein
MLEQERQYFSDHLNEWLRLYPGKFVVIKGDRLLGAFDTNDEALAAGAREYGLEPFLVRRVQPMQEEVKIPALTLGLLRADSTHPV